MTSARNTPLALLASALLLLAGCTSSGRTASWHQDGSQVGDRTYAGWNTPRGANDTETTDTEAEGESITEVPAGVCYVKAPFIPATTETIEVLKRPERRALNGELVIPAEFVTVELAPEGEGFAWIPTVCEDSMDRHLVMRVQEALISRGYDIGGVDGVMGPATREGLEYFKRAQKLYGEGLTHDVLEQLGIDPQTGGPAFAGI